jgi:hypothetical protein
MEYVLGEFPRDIMRIGWSTCDGVTILTGGGGGSPSTLSYAELSCASLVTW